MGRNVIKGVLTVEPTDSKLFYQVLHAICADM
jgi:hypothetical protein